MTTTAVNELRTHPRTGDIRTGRCLSADSQLLADRAAYIRRLREERALGIRFVSDFRRAA